LLFKRIARNSDFAIENAKVVLSSGNQVLQNVSKIYKTLEIKVCNGYNQIEICNNNLRVFDSRCNLKELAIERF